MIVVYIIVTCSLIIGIGYSLYHLFWFIWNNRAEEGKSYANPNVKGSDKKELFVVLWKTVRVVLIVIGILIIWAVFDGKFDRIHTKNESVQEESSATIISENNSEYKIPYDLLESTPNSSCFSAIGYDQNNDVLVLVFRDSGNTYIYTDFPHKEWTSFTKAKSLGGYYNSSIKGNYNCYRAR